MKIVAIEMFPVSVPLKATFHMRDDSFPSMDSVLIKIHTDVGIVGIAEVGMMSSWYLGETQEGIMAMIAKVFAPQILLGADPRDIESIVTRMDVVTRGNNQAKALVDFALHDIKGKAFGVPVYQLLGGKSAPAVKLGWVLSADSPADTVAAGRKALAMGYHNLKLKVSADIKQDMECIVALREAVGPDIEMILDVNGAWNYDQASRMLPLLEKHGISQLEQPLPYWDIEGLARLRERSSIRVYADESAMHPEDLNRLIRFNSVDGMFLKVVKAGGLLKSQRWISIAQSVGLPVMCGCMLGCGFEAAAQAHLLVSNKWASQFHHENLGVVTVHGVWDTVSQPITGDLAREVPRYENGLMYAPEAPGLGLELNEDLFPEVITRGVNPVKVGADV
jgi:L-alanine-DL-glutamate epimerase-like enolase superfamily enzyme